MIAFFLSNILISSLSLLALVLFIISLIVIMMRSHKGDEVLDAVPDAASSSTPQTTPLLPTDIRVSDMSMREHDTLPSVDVQDPLPMVTATESPQSTLQTQSLPPLSSWKPSEAQAPIVSEDTDDPKTIGEEVLSTQKEENR
ncbi:MAG: hypothetical protein RI935_299 [Candidatus Parcubacteria bacterium]|jgi:hypothetical protein